MNNVSFRDNSGFIFEHNGEIYRQINKIYKDEYEKLMSCGLYKELTEKELLIPHKEINLSAIRDDNCYKYIKPERIKFISYPYEWCFSQLKDAALLTLQIQKIALKYNMSLKDASGFNIQFLKGKPVFIDTLSFETYKENSPWIAYGQFCRHFLAPLVLMKYTDISLNKLLITNIDGIPLNLCCKLLPLKAKLKPEIFVHIILHSYSINDLNSKMDRGGGRLLRKNRPNRSNLINRATETSHEPYANKFSKLAMESLIDSLETVIKSLTFPKATTEWANYYTCTNYTNEAFREKEEIVREFIKISNPRTICDLGANRGDFSRAAANTKPDIHCLSFDIDPVAVESNYKLVRKNNETNILPLLLDLTNPAPAIGFANREREDFLSRFKCDTVMALALIHHLAISNNLPFENIAKFLAELGNNLIIEFVPKEDSKVQLMLSSRKDIFDNYNVKIFEKEFSKFFKITAKKSILTSMRTIYLMRRK